MTSPVDLYAVIGNPVSHSLSPVIHANFADQTQQLLRYSLVEPQEESFEQAVDQFFTDGGLGLSVTAPFKERAWVMSVHRTERAEQAGAVNTLWRDEQGILHGDNTDGAGFITDLEKNHGFSFDGKRVLILGAGGAVRGVLPPLLSHPTEKVIISNRTPYKAVELAVHFGSSKLESQPLNAMEEPFDLIINGTSLAVRESELGLSLALFHAETFCYDLNYNLEQNTPFVDACKKLGASHCVDGLGMLVEQAALQFERWRGVLPNTQPLLIR